MRIIFLMLFLLSLFFKIEIIQAADPFFADVSKCFFIYAPIFEIARDNNYKNLYMFAQSRVSWIGGYVQANKSNKAFEKIFNDNMEKNKQFGEEIENILLSAIQTQDEKKFDWIISQAAMCDKEIGIETKWVPNIKNFKN